VGGARGGVCGGPRFSLVRRSSTRGRRWAGGRVWVKSRREGLLLAATEVHRHFHQNIVSPAPLRHTAPALGTPPHAANTLP